MTFVLALLLDNTKVSQKCIKLFGEAAKFRSLVERGVRVMVPDAVPLDQRSHKAAQ